MNWPHWLRWLRWLVGKPPVSAAGRLDEPDIAQEKAQIRRDVGQIKELNEYLLNKAVARGRMSPEAAAAIRASQTYEREVMDIGSGSKPN
jgi:hypothetical protein